MFGSVQILCNIFLIDCGSPFLKKLIFFFLILKKRMKEKGVNTFFAFTESDFKKNSTNTSYYADHVVCVVFLLFCIRGNR